MMTLRSSLTPVFLAAVVLAATIASATPIANPAQPCIQYDQRKGDAITDKPTILSSSPDRLTFTDGLLNGYKAYVVDQSRTIQLVAGGDKTWPRNVMQVDSYDGQHVYYYLNRNDACTVVVPFDVLDSIYAVKIHKVASY